MRNVWLTALLAFCLLSAGWILVQNQPAGAEGALASVLGAVEPEGGDASSTTASADAAGAPRDDSEPTFYRYTDESGSVRFVTSLGAVPRHLRDEARPVTSNRVQRTATAAPRPRPAARVRAEPVLARNRDVIVYTTTWCGWCRKTLAFLDENGIVYENRDIEVDDAWRQELRQKTGATSIPVVEIDGEIIRGYDPKRMRRLLQTS